MLQLTYISSAVANVGDKDVDAILLSARHHNARADVTGLLVYDGKRFLQALEGSADAVRATYERIKRDPRHRAVVLLSERQVDARQFGRWDMAAERVSAVRSGRSVPDLVEALVKNLPDASTRELFRSFARMKREAA
jgi:hypothetical protein